MANFSFKPPAQGADFIEGTDADDLAIAVNDTLNAGDFADLKGGTDTVRHAVDANLAGNVAVGTVNARQDFSGFTFQNVEILEIINDSTLAQGIRYDMSSSPGIQRFRITNSSSQTTIDQIARSAIGLPVIEIDRSTNAGAANVNIGFQAAALTGADDTVTLVVNSTDVNNVDIGTSNNAAPLNPTNTGIENLQINVSGDSTIASLTSGASRINIDGDGSVSIIAQLDAATRTIVSRGAGDRSLTLGDAGVSYQGDAGDDTIVGGAGNDTINTADGDDIIDGRGGNDTINAGGGDNVIRTGTGINTVVSFSGNDRIFSQGTDTIDSGQGNDVIDITGTLANVRTVIRAGDGSDRVDGGTSFDASNGAGFDQVDMGTGFDILEVGVGLNDAQLFQASNVEALAVTTGAVTNLSGGIGGRAQLAGIYSVYFASGNANDTLNAGSYTADMIVSNGQEYGGRGLGGDDTVTTGSGADAILWRGNNALTNADSLNAGGQATATTAGTVDGLYLSGDTTLAGGGGFRNVEYIALETTRGSIYAGLAGDTGAQYNITLENANAPTSGRIFINASSLQADTDGVGPLVQETVTLSTVNVTAYAVDVYTGQGDDRIDSGIAGEVIVTDGGNDIVNAGGGNDTIDTGLGNDTVNLQSGNNQLTDAGGNNTITLGTGNDRLLLGDGNDTIVAGTNLTAGDSVPGFGGGNDTLRVFGRNYADGDFSGLGGGLETLEIGSRAGDIGAAAGDEAFTFTLGSAVAATNIDRVVVNGAGASNVQAGAITRGLTFDLSAGGNDVLTGTQGNDVIIAGTGDQIVAGGAGNDTLRVSGFQLNLSDTFLGGAGNDKIELDNTFGAVSALVNLSQVVGVERYEYVTNGQRVNPDPDANSITFANATAATVNTLTNITVDTSKLTDNEDSTTITLDASMTEADFDFDIFGSSTTTTVVKQNVGINNDINFVGGSGVDVLEINGGDLGSTTTFNGAGGNTDAIRQTGGVISDDSYIRVQNVEVLEGTAASALNASLGAQAARSGLQLVRGTNGNDNVLLDAAFTNTLRVELGGGNDVINGAATTSQLTISATDSQFTAADVLTAGSGGTDVLEVTAANGTADLTNTAGFETVDVRGDNNSLLSTGTTVILDTTAAQVVGGRQVVTATGFGATDAFRLGGDAATANLTVTSGEGNDVIRTGSGADVIVAAGGNNQVSAGAGIDTITTLGGNDRIDAGTGADTVNAGGGNDVVNGGAGNDVLNGENGADALRGEAGDDTINGGGGNDQIEGGAGRDLLTGGTGADTFFYRNVSDSAGTLGRDTITDFVSGEDRIDIGALLGVQGQTGPFTGINFRGNFDTFTDTQGAVIAGDNVIDAVFQKDANLVWFDTNDDGALNANDLQIRLDNVLSLTGADVGAGAFPNTASYDAFSGLFTPIDVVSLPVVI